MTETLVSAERAALDVLDRHIAALNVHDSAALAATLHFPHYRLAGGRMQIWDKPENYFADFLNRAGDGWHHSAWNRRTIVAASIAKVHLDVAFTRFRRDGSVLGQFGSLWIIAFLDGRWAAQARSSFAA